MMLNTVYKDAVTKRDKMLAVLRGPKFDRIVQEAQNRWVEFEPTRQDTVTAGIDSSFNVTKFQGVELWAATAVSVRPDGEILADLHDAGLGSGTDPSRIAVGMEVDACQDTVDRAELVLMDGSLHSQLMTRQPGLGERIIRAMKKRDNVLFVAKTSNTRKQFEDLGSLAGDIFYYNHGTRGPGFSRPFVEKTYGEGRTVSSTFVRLSDSTPIIKVEFLGEDREEPEIKEMVNRLYKNSVGGYPYALKLAHKNCKISDREIARMVSLLGLSNEIGSRAVLE